MRMEKKKRNRFLVVWLGLIVLTLVAVLAVGGGGESASIKETMRDAVLHGTNRISLFGLKAVDPAFISALVVSGVLLLAALLCAAPALAADSAAPTAAPIPTALAASAAQGGALHLDFSRDLAGFTPLLADYPQGADAFYELDVSRQPIPIAGAGFGLRLTGNNHSDDLFLGACRLLEGLPPETPCVFTVTLRIATDVDGGLIGIGGSPGSSVFFKCGITAAEPRREVVDGSYRLTLDATAGDTPLKCTVWLDAETLLPRYAEFAADDAVVVSAKLLAFSCALQEPEQ